MYQPNEVVVSPDDRFLFVALFQADRQEVRIVDLDGDSLYAVVPTGGSAFLEDLSPDGAELYVADWGSNTVSVVDPVGMTLLETLADERFSKPHGVAFSPDGRYAFVTSENRDGTAPEHHPGSPGGPNGNVAVIDTQTREVVKVIELGPVAAGIAVLH
jgi:YVTN family beta-propeller protein